MDAFVVRNSESGSRADSLAQLRIDIRTDLPSIEQIAGLRFFGGLDKSLVARNISAAD